MRPTYRHITVTSLRLWKDGSCSRSKLNTMGTSRQAIQSANRIYLRSLARLAYPHFVSRVLSLSFSWFLRLTKRQFPDGRAFPKCFVGLAVPLQTWKVTSSSSNLVRRVNSQFGAHEFMEVEKKFFSFIILISRYSIFISAVVELESKA